MRFETSIKTELCLRNTMSAECSRTFQPSCTNLYRLCWSCSDGNRYHCYWQFPATFPPLLPLIRTAGKRTCLNSTSDIGKELLIPLKPTRFLGVDADLHFMWATVIHFIFSAIIFTPHCCKQFVRHCFSLII